MKTAVFFLFLAFTTVYCDDSKSSEEETIEEIAKYARENFNLTIVDDIMKLKERVMKKCPDLEDKIDDTVTKTAECIDNIELGSNTFCSLIRNNFMKCSKPLREVITECLPDESKDLTVISEKIILAIIDTVCNSTVEQVLELFNPCWAEKDFSDFPSCVDIKTAFDEHRNKLPSKSLICTMLPKMKKCEVAHQEASCPNPITKKAYSQFHEAIEDATAEECASVNQP